MSCVWEDGVRLGAGAEERKRGALAAQAPSPRGVEGRKRAVRSTSQLGYGLVAPLVPLGFATSNI